MEEMKFRMKGLTIVGSSELLDIRGGAAAESSIGPALKKLIDFLKSLGKYLPDFLEGLKDGLN